MKEKKICIIDEKFDMKNTILHFLSFIIFSPTGHFFQIYVMVLWLLTNI